MVFSNFITSLRYPFEEYLRTHKSAGLGFPIKNYARVWIRNYGVSCCTPNQDSNFAFLRMKKRELKCRQKTGIYVHSWTYSARHTEPVCRFCSTPKSFANHTAYMRRQESVRMVQRKKNV